MDNKSGINLEEEKFLFLDDRREEEEKSYLTERSRISTLSRTELCSNRKEISPLETTGETSVELICRVVRRTNERHRERECEKKKEMNNHTTGFFVLLFSTILTHIYVRVHQKRSGRVDREFLLSVVR